MNPTGASSPAGAATGYQVLRRLRGAGLSLGPRLSTARCTARFHFDPRGDR
jgi:hypothetical protein